MKKLPIFLFMLILYLASCQEDEPGVNMDLPQWLKEKTQYDEDYVSQNPKSMFAYGVWLRTEWKESYYFEYSNQLSSSLYRPVTYECDTLKVFIGDNKSFYHNEKCCSMVIWHGNRIDEEYLQLFHGN